MLKAYKYRLYPDDDQKIQLPKTFGCVRFIYNYYLNKKIELYKTEKKYMSKIDCNNHYNEKLKNENVWLKEVDKFTLTNAIYDLDNAFHKFSKEHTGYSKFKTEKSVPMFDNWTIIRLAITYFKFSYQLVTREANTVIYRAIKNLPIILPKEVMHIQGTMSWAGDVAKMLLCLVLNLAKLKKTYTVATS